MIEQFMGGEVIKRKNIIAFIILIFSLILPLWLYSGSLDAFASQHIVPIIDINNVGHVPGDIIINTPAFYTFGSILSLITGIVPESLLFIPIQLIPITLITFLLFRKISGSNLVASLIVIILATIDISGGKFFFWIHGMGNILFLLIIFLLAKQLDYKKAENIILIFISIAVLIYTSYDLTFSIISLLMALLLLITFNEKILSKGANNNSRHASQFTSIILFLLIIQLALSEFVYKTLIPQFQGIEGSNPLDNFLFSYLSADNSSLPISVIYPQIIGILGILKYLVIAIFLMLAIIFIIKKLRSSKSLGDNINLIFIAMIFAVFAYIAAKYILGQFAVGGIFIIGAFGIAVVYKNYNNEKIKKIALISLISILAINLGIFTVYSENNYINKDYDKFNYIDYTATWYYNYSNGSVTSDVLTSNYFYLFTSKNKLDEKKIHYDTIRVFSPYKDIYPIIQLQSPVKTKKNGYYILNYKLNVLDLNGWKTVKPWHEYTNEIDNNTDYNEIYDSEDISILY